MSTNTANPKYDLCLEILCSLTPGPTLVRELVEEFHLANESQLRETMAKSMPPGVDVVWDNHGKFLLGEKGRTLRVTTETWAQCQAVCLQYWRDIYPSEQETF